MCLTGTGWGLVGLYLRLVVGHLIRVQKYRFDFVLAYAAYYKTIWKFLSIYNIFKYDDKLKKISNHMRMHLQMFSISLSDSL